MTDYYEAASFADVFVGQRLPALWDFTSPMPTAVVTEKYDDAVVIEWVSGSRVHRLRSEYGQRVAEMLVQNIRASAYYWVVVAKQPIDTCQALRAGDHTLAELARRHAAITACGRADLIVEETDQFQAIGRVR